jgi:SAM-dependent methyltransferase
MGVVYCDVIGASGNFHFAGSADASVLETLMSDQDRWNERYRQQQTAPTAAKVLTDNIHLLPKQGTALDLACGLGGNALLLAQQGLEVSAWDIADVALEQLAAQAQAQQLSIQIQQRDVSLQPPSANSFDVIVVSRFLDRELCPAIQQALKPGGLLFYQTFCHSKVSQQGPSNPGYLLADNDLLSLFLGLNVRVYREEALLGDCHAGWRDQALLVAQRVK